MVTFIKPADGRLTSHFGRRLHPIDKVMKGHSGIDIAKSGNVPVVASADGVVTRVGALGTYGNVVMIKHDIFGQVYETNYAHLHSWDVKVGQKVKQGQRIARMGNTGNSTGQHVHFEIHKGRWASGQPNAVDPLTLIGKDLSPKLRVDGYEGPLTIKAEQRYHGTPVDGIISKPSLVVKARQKMLGVKQDGYAGPITIRAEQRRYGTPVDGFVSKPSLMIKERQRRLNKGKL